ncbi:hypothetical protein Hanom_Chr06g00575741 [Helianthus anomalus]
MNYFNPTTISQVKTTRHTRLVNHLRQQNQPQPKRKPEKKNQEKSYTKGTSCLMVGEFVDLIFSCYVWSKVVTHE